MLVRDDSMHMYEEEKDPMKLFFNEEMPWLRSA